MIVIFNDESDVILFLIVGRSATCLRLTMAIDSSVVASSNLKIVKFRKLLVSLCYESLLPHGL